MQPQAPQTFLKLLVLCRYGRLAKMPPFGCPSNTALYGNHLEIKQMQEVNPRSTGHAAGVGGGPETFGLQITSAI